MTRVLIVDDEPLLRRSLGRLLGTAGYECIFAGCTEEALAVAARERLDLVLSDINMPGPSGLSLAAQLRRDHPELAVVMVTAVTDPKAGATAVDLGAAGYLTKPFEPNEILVTVSNAVRQQRLEQQHTVLINDLEAAVNKRTTSLRDAVADLDRSKTLLQASREETLHRLAMAAEFRDNETAGHLRRMSVYSKMLATQLGLSPASCEQLRLASLMHDVGKLGIPDAILLKPGPLTAAEFETMKQHAGIGYRLLTGTGGALLERAAMVAATHHEKYDGTGYPGGLAGDKIPRDGRIVAVTDVFDALTSPRVYRGPIPVEEAIAMIREQRGSHFDPQIFDAFLEILPEILAVHRAHSDEWNGE